MRNDAYAGAAKMLLVAIGTLCAGLAIAKDKLPQTTADGLERIKSKQVQALYWRPGATLEGYKRVQILEPFVAFRKNWEREQNTSRAGTQRVTAQDMERIKKILAEDFMKVFRDELQEKGGYQIVAEPGEHVLLLRPAIVNLDVSAPDIPSAGRTRTFVASAGSMTLYLELYDSATGELIGKAIDSRQAPDTGGFQIANSVTNRAEANRILRRWAGLLRGALDEEWRPRQ